MRGREFVGLENGEKLYGMQLQRQISGILAITPLPRCNPV